jgi:hypothetical protein
MDMVVWGENGMIKKLVQMQKITMTDRLSFNGGGSQQVNWAFFSRMYNDVHRNGWLLRRLMSWTFHLGQL